MIRAFNRLHCHPAQVAAGQAHTLFLVDPAAAELEKLETFEPEVAAEEAPAPAAGAAGGAKGASLCISFSTSSQLLRCSAQQRIHRVQRSSVFCAAGDSCSSRLLPCLIRAAAAFVVAFYACCFARQPALPGAKVLGRSAVHPQCVCSNVSGAPGRLWGVGCIAGGKRKAAGSGGAAKKGRK